LRWGFRNFFCPDWPGTTTLPISTTWVVRITCVSHQCLAALGVSNLGVHLI
jgi:hypothetical protein